MAMRSLAHDLQYQNGKKAVQIMGDLHDALEAGGYDRLETEVSQEVGV